MTSRKKQRDHRSDIKNGNWGTPGTNITWDRAQGNRGKQLDPNRAQDGQSAGPRGQGTIARPSGQRRR
jgi:hypothetical protein